MPTENQIEKFRNWLCQESNRWYWFYQISEQKEFEDFFKTFNGPNAIQITIEGICKLVAAHAIEEIMNHE